MSKRGISPLIATVLIIGFTIALGVIIILWGGDFIRGMQERAESTGGKAYTCAAASVKVGQIEQSAPSALDFLLENTGSADVERVIVRVTGDVGSDSVSMKKGLKSAGKKSFHVKFDAGKVGTVSGAEVIPIVSIAGKSEPCTPGVDLGVKVPSEDIVSQWEIGKGNGVIDSWEECDYKPGDFKFPLMPDGSSVSCGSFGYSGGVLGCTVYGTIDVSGCADYGIEGASTCDNNVLDDGEGCDYVNGAPQVIGGLTTCVSLDEALIAAGEEGMGYTIGNLDCAPDCMIDVSQCSTEEEEGPAGGEEEPPAGENYGNGVIDAGEECDGTNLAGQSCGTIGQGFTGGTLACETPGQFDTSLCTPATTQYCGNDKKEGAEVCDGSDLDSKTCAGIVTWTGAGGILKCKSDCTGFDTTSCTGCGNGKIEGTEQCDGANLNGKNCKTIGLGFIGGTLACKTGCTFNTAGCTEITNVAGGAYDICALASNNEIYCWGQNTAGQLGDTTTTDRSIPTKAQITGVAKLAPASLHTCALKSNGEVWCWGDNGYGQLAIAGITQTATPTKSLMTSATQITAGLTHYTCALKSNGEVWCWGHNNLGQLGDATIIDKSIPTKAQMPVSGVIQIAAGATHTCALVSGGNVYCWGSNSYGELGIAVGDITPRNVPTKTAMTGATQIATGSYFTCALKSDNTVWCWGRNNYGQLGINSVTSKEVPIQTTITGVTQITAGIQHACALKSDNTVWCWGSNSVNQLGTGVAGGQKLFPVQSLMTNAKQISTKGSTTCALNNNRELWCWGKNDYGQLCDGTTTNSPTPIKITFP